MSIHENLKKSIPDAMRAHDAVKLQTLRSIITMMTNEVVSKKRKPDEFLTDEEALAVLKRAANQRKDSIEQFTTGGRPELALAESKELKILETYLPATMPRAQIAEVVRVKKAELGITDKTGAGKLIGAVSKELKGKAEGSDIKAVVDELFA